MATRPPSQHYFPGLSKLYSSLDQLAYLLVRVAVGCILIPHGMQKLFGAFGGPGMTIHRHAAEGRLLAHSWRRCLVWLIALLEFGGGILLVIGLFTRPVALAVLIFMLEACASITASAVFFWTGRGNEYPMILAGGLALSADPRRRPYSVDAKMGKEFWESPRGHQRKSAGQRSALLFLRLRGRRRWWQRLSLRRATCTVISPTCSIFACITSPKPGPGRTPSGVPVMMMSPG